MKLVSRIRQDEGLVDGASRPACLHTRLYCLLGLDGALLATHLLAIKLLLSSKSACGATHLRLALKSLQIILARAEFHSLLFLLLEDGNWSL